MVRIIELMEDELVLPKVLNPGESSDLEGVKKPADYKTIKALDNIRVNQENLRHLESTMRMKYKWTGPATRELKTPEDIESEKQRYEAAKLAMHTDSQNFVKEVEDAIPFIEKNCSKYLPILHNSGFLYRGFGIDNLPHAVFYGYPRSDRKARDSIADLQVDFDKVLVKLGVNALRSNSLFCVGDSAGAAAYGLPFVIIPCNDATFAWSRNYHDIVLDKFNVPKFTELNRQYNLGGIRSDDYLKEFQKQFQIKAVDLDDAIKQHHEVWIKGHYVAVLATLEPQLRKLLFGS